MITIKEQKQLRKDIASDLFLHNRVMEFLKGVK
jgi:hypothetical protein